MSRVVRVVDGPVDADGTILRIVELTDGSVRIESWADGFWSPGGDAITFMQSPPAAPELLDRLGIPYDVNHVDEYLRLVRDSAPESNGHAPANGQAASNGRALSNGSALPSSPAASNGRSSLAAPQQAAGVPAQASEIVALRRTVEDLTRRLGSIERSAARPAGEPDSDALSGLHRRLDALEHATATSLDAIEQSLDGRANVALPTDGADAEALVRRIENLESRLEAAASRANAAPETAEVESLASRLSGIEDTLARSATVGDVAVDHDGLHSIFAERIEALERSVSRRIDEAVTGVAARTAGLERAVRALAEGTAELEAAISSLDRSRRESEEALRRSFDERLAGQSEQIRHSLYADLIEEIDAVKVSAKGLESRLDDEAGRLGTQMRVLREATLKIAASIARARGEGLV